MEIWKRNLYVCWVGAFLTSAALSQVAPILPLYIRELGMMNLEDVAVWSGFAFGATTLVMTFVSPIWGKLADEYGRKPMLLRASLGMAVVFGATAFITSVWELVALRLLMGVISGYNAAAITLIATETPREQSGWALGTLSTGAVSGQLIGPLLGGYLVEMTGIRDNFIVMSLLMALSFLLTLRCVKEDFARPSRKAVKSLRDLWNGLEDRRLLLWMFMTTYLVMTTLFFVQPVLTIYIGILEGQSEHIAMLAGITFAASGISAIVSAPRLGRLSDQIGAHKVLCAALCCGAVLSIPQAFVQSVWQLIALRFLMGISTGAMLPSINTLLRQHIPADIAGRVFSLNQSAQFLGTFSGALLGGQVTAHAGVRVVFAVVAVILSGNAVCVYYTLWRRFA